MQRIIEIRTYQLKAGMAAQFRQTMLAASLPLLRGAGTDVVASCASLHSADAYVLIRAYDDLAQRRRSQDAFYSGAAWLDGPRDAVMACIDSYTTAVLSADGELIDALRRLPA
ncbi:NIPSNAP family protein [Janthinobacterium sp.]|uniref:NIPSNAP family protein n=1 Tax=Janthinobacterium sp. TaxID=1871054 RepID=UPI00293D3B2D|nr:NIPSNAP family protein [Janthinobacterium sp.]